ncbi:hypothetical protein U91I_03592 [alpha proteobacterium U9-1i]|nr:hypothetical protein U91I_03592 [alpha proteobacterium U9-1i]
MGRIRRAVLSTLAGFLGIALLIGLAACIGWSLDRLGWAPGG